MYAAAITRMITLVLLFSASVLAVEFITFKGTITGPDDKPVEKAAISIYTFGMNMEQMSYDIKLVKQVESDSSGLFSCTADTSGWNLKNSAIVCYAQKPGFSVAFEYVHSEAMSLKLTSPRTLSGQVKDVRGNPVADALVQLPVVSVPGGQMQMAFGLDPIPFFTAHTDAQGRFAITNLPENCTAEFLVKKTGLAPFYSMKSNINPLAIGRPGPPSRTCTISSFPIGPIFSPEDAAVYSMRTFAPMPGS